MNEGSCSRSSRQGRLSPQERPSEGTTSPEWAILPPPRRWRKRSHVIFLNHFQPETLDTRDFVNRNRERERLVGAFSSYFEEARANPSDTQSRRQAVVIGGKGIGKSLLGRCVVHQLREKYSDSTIFVEVDCRPTNTLRQVLEHFAQSLLRNIADDDDAEAGGKSKGVSPRLEAAQLFSALVHSTKAKRRQLQSRITGFSAVANFGLGRLVRAVETTFQVGVSAKREIVESLDIEVEINDAQLFSLAQDLIEDLRRNGTQVFLFLDNLDELRHSYHTEDSRAETETMLSHVLSLTDGPVASLLCMRAYFHGGSLTRSRPHPLALGPLSAEEQWKILQNRLARENASVQAALRTPGAEKRLRELATNATTPLALLRWVGALAESEAGIEGDLQTEKAASRKHYGGFYQSQLAELFALFERAGMNAQLPQEDILAAIGGNEKAFRAFTQNEVLLPVDFWAPSHYTLDPTIRWF